MKNQVEALGVVTKQGILEIYSQPQFLKEICRRWPEKEIILIAKKKVKTVTNKQRGYYFGVICTLIEKRFEEWGNEITQRQVDFMLREMYLFDEIVTPHGEVIKKILSLKDMAGEVGRRRMSKYWEQCWQWAAETLDLVIPSPDPQWWNKKD